MARAVHSHTHTQTLLHPVYNARTNIQSTHTPGALPDARVTSACGVVVDTAMTTRAILFPVTKCNVGVALEKRQEGGGGQSFAEESGCHLKYFVRTFKKRFCENNL